MLSSPTKPNAVDLIFHHTRNSAHSVFRMEPNINQKKTTTNRCICVVIVSVRRQEIMYYESAAFRCENITNYVKKNSYSKSTK